MRRVFIDSSVLFAAAYSARGHSRDLLTMGAEGRIQIVFSGLVIRETERNIEEINPEKTTILTRLVESVSAEIVEATKEQIEDAAEYIALKDAPILAAAKAAQVDMLITLDKRHFLNRPLLVEYAGIAIITPKEAMERLFKP